MMANQYYSRSSQKEGPYGNGLPAIRERAEVVLEDPRRYIYNRLYRLSPYIALAFQSVFRGPCSKPRENNIVAPYLDALTSIQRRHPDAT